MLNQIKIGDRVCVKDWPHVPATISNIYMVDRDGNETKWEFECAEVKLELDWGQFGKSKVSLHDQNKVWYLHKISN